MDNVYCRLFTALAQYIDVGMLQPAVPPQNLYTIRGPIYVEPSGLQPQYYQQQQSMYGQQGLAVGPPMVGPPMVGPPIVGPPVVGQPITGPPGPYGPSPYNPYAPTYPNQMMYDEQQDEVSPQTRRLNTNVQSGIQQIGQGNMNLQGNIQQVNRRSQTQPLQASRTFQKQNNQNQRNGLDQDEANPMTRAQIMGRGKQQDSARAVQLLDEQMHSLLRGGQLLNDPIYADQEDPMQALLRGQQLNDPIFANQPTQLNDPIFTTSRGQLLQDPVQALLRGQQLNDPIYPNQPTQLNDQLYGNPGQQNDQIYATSRGQLLQDQVQALLRSQQLNDPIYSNQATQMNDPIYKSRGQMLQDPLQALLRGQQINDPIFANQATHLNDPIVPSARGQQIQNDQIYAFLRGQQQQNDPIYAHPGAQQQNDQLYAAARGQFQQDQLQALAAKQLQNIGRDQTQGHGWTQSMNGLMQSHDNQQQRRSVFKRQEEEGRDCWFNPFPGCIPASRQNKGYLSDETELFDESSLMHSNKRTGPESMERRVVDTSLNDEQDDDSEEQDDFDIDIYADKSSKVKILQR